MLALCSFNSQLLWTILCPEQSLYHRLLCLDPENKVLFTYGSTYIDIQHWHVMHTTTYIVLHIHMHILSVCDILVYTCHTFWHAHIVCTLFMHSMYNSSTAVLPILHWAIKTIGTKFCLGFLLAWYWSWVVFSLYSAKQVQKLAEELEEVC